jgi:histone H3/H4
MEEIATTIAKSAVEMSIHAGRKTIRGEDIKLASKTFIKS